MPHLVRESKDTDQYKGAIPVHVVSQFVFGAPIPILGFINLADIVKNSSLTVVNIHRSITMQFEQLMNEERMRIEHVKSINPDAQDDECIPRLSTWPRSLHICFDNAGGENINSNVFLYFSVLVHMGVFEYITISTLFVGHTHNINDQLFSVWSKWLDHNDCISLEIMMSAFEDNYHTYMERELVNLQGQDEQLSNDGAESVLGNKEADEDVDMNDEGENSKGGAAAANESSDESNYDDATNSSDARAGLSWKQKSRRRTHAETCLINTIKKCGEIAKPKMEKVPCNAHIGGWLPKDIRDRIAKVNPFKHILKYHVFAIGKENGDTFLFRKFTVNSELIYKKRPHEFTFNEVKYRKKHLVLLEREKIVNDPMQMPFNYVETARARELIDVLEKQRVFDSFPTAKEQLENTLSTLEKQVEEQATVCAECATFVKEVAKIGPIKKPQPNGDKETVAQQKREYNDKLGAKNKLQDAYHAHLSDPAVEAHVNQQMKGWWSTWVNERIPVITEYYLRNGVFQHMADAADASGMNGLAEHPEDYDEEEAFVHCRVPNTCLSKYGPPKPGHIVLVRQALSKGEAPFMIGVIRAYRNRTLADIALENDVLKVAGERDDHKERKLKGAVPPWPANAVGLNLVEVDENSTAKDDDKNKSAGRGKDKLLQTYNTFQFKNVLVDWYDEVIKPSRKRPKASAGCGRKTNKKAKGGDDDDDDDEYILTSSEEDFDEAFNDDTPLSKVVQSQVASLAYDGSPTTMEVDTDNEAGPAASASASSAAPAAAASAGGPAAAAASEVDTSAAGAAALPVGREFVPLKEADITPFRQKEYGKLDKNDNLYFKRWLDVADIICWGPPNEVFTKGKKLKKTIWDWIVQDLTQDVMEE